MEVKRMPPGLERLRPDPVEQRYAAYVRDRFPQYEAFWAEFVVPLREPGTLRVHAVTELERMATAHYAVLWHLAFCIRSSQRLQVRTRRQAVFNARPAFEASLYHLSAAAERVEEFLGAWAVVAALCEMEGAPAGGPPPVVPKLTRDQFMSIAEAFYDGGRYDKQFDTFKESWQPVAMYVHTGGSPAGEFVSGAGSRAEEAYESFRQASEHMREYRNRVVHGAMLASLLEGLTLLVPTLEALKRYPSPLALRRGKNRADFVEAAQLLGGFRGPLEDSINAVWEAIAHRCQQLKDTHRYQEWLQSRPAPAPSMEWEAGRQALVRGIISTGSFMGEVSPEDESARTKGQ